MMYFARGVVQVLTKGNPIYPFPDTFNFLGQGYILHVPVCVIIAAILGLLAHVVLKYTVFGRALYAVGGNAETARHSGIKVPSIQTWMYLLSGVAAGVAGVLTTARLGSAQANAGTGMELQVIAACVIGGTSMFGGEGSVLGSLIGALFMGIIANGLVLMRISVFYQNMVIGAVIIVAVGIDQYKRKASGI
jgi:ribose/xylose/arabinose/galactoside ABC-type transport system permease subunit